MHDLNHLVRFLSVLEIDQGLSGLNEIFLNNKEQVTELLGIVDQIPEEVLQQGDAPTNKWVTAKIPLNISSTKGMASTDGFLGCSGAILVTIGTTAFPAAKLLKIKRYMNALAGTTVLSGIIFFSTHNTLLALLFAVLGVLVWVAVKPSLGQVPPKGSRPDVKKVRGYRKEYPDATIGDGILETAKFKD